MLGEGRHSASGPLLVVSVATLLRLVAGRTPADTSVRGWSAVLAGVGGVGAHPLLSRMASVQILAPLSTGAGFSAPMCWGGVDLTLLAGSPTVAFPALGGYGVGTSTG